MASEVVAGFDYGRLRRVLREELTSGDAAARKPLTDLALSATLKDSAGAELSSYVKNLDTKISDFKTALLSSILKDSTGAELSSYVKNLDAALSTRASEATLSAVKAQTDKLSFDAANRLAVQNPPNLDVALSTRASESTLSAVKANTDRLDVALSVLAALQRWGRNVSPAWVHGAEVTAPAANTALVSVAVSAGKAGFIYGLFISAQEANDFKVSWTSGATAYSRRIVFAGKGSLQYVDIVPLNEGLPADAGSSVTITNVNAASAGMIYQAAILYAEV